MIFGKKQEAAPAADPAAITKLLQGHDAREAELQAAAAGAHPQSERGRRVAQALEASVRVRGRLHTRLALLEIQQCVPHARKEAATRLTQAEAVRDAAQRKLTAAKEQHLLRSQKLAEIQTKHTELLRNLGAPVATARDELTRATEAGDDAGVERASAALSTASVRKAEAQAKAEPLRVQCEALEAVLGRLAAEIDAATAELSAADDALTPARQEVGAVELDAACAAAIQAAQAYGGAGGAMPNDGLVVSLGWSRCVRELAGDHVRLFGHMTVHGLRQLVDQGRQHRFEDLLATLDPMSLSGAAPTPTPSGAASVSTEEERTVVQLVPDAGQATAGASRQAA